MRLLFKDRKKLLKHLLAYTREADKRFYLQQKYDTRGLKFVDLSQLAQIHETIDNYTFLGGTSRLSDIVLLMALCRNYRNCQYLEIGTWRGESISNVSKVATKCTSISLSKEELLSLGMRKEAAELQRYFSKDIHNIRHIEANSLTFDFRSLNEKYDVIFIDGDHAYSAVKSDTQNAFNLLKDETSVIVWHDFGRNYEDFRYEVISAALDGAPPEKRENIYRVSNTLCGIYTSQPGINPKYMQSPQIPNKEFSVSIQLNKF